MIKKIPPLLSIMALTLLIQSCGFQLRGTGDTAQLPAHISPVMIEGLGQYSPVRAEMRQMLEASGVAVTTESATAASRLRILGRASDRRTLSVDSSGKAVEYELHEGVTFDLIDSTGASLVSSQTADTVRDYENTQTEVLGKQQEEALLRENMRFTLINRVIQMLSAQLK